MFLFFQWYYCQLHLLSASHDSSTVDIKCPFIPAFLYTKGYTNWARTSSKEIFMEMLSQDDNLIFMDAIMWSWINLTFRRR